MVFDRIKRAFSGSIKDVDDAEYIEIDLGQDNKKKKIHGL